MGALRNNVIPLLCVLCCWELVFAARKVAPRGWNGFDAQLNHVNETKLYEIADAMRDQLLPSGYDTLVLDAGWTGQNPVTRDEYCRMRPSAEMYPSTKVPGQKDTTLAPIVDGMKKKGLKTGIWTIRGVDQGCVDKKLPVKGTSYTLDQIVNQNGQLDECLWDKAMIAVNHTHPGAQPYYDSIAELFIEEYGVSFIKFDCAYLSHGKGEAAMGELMLWHRAMEKMRVRGENDVKAQLSISPGGVRLDNTRAEVVVHNMEGAMYRIWPDYHGGMPTGQMREAATLVSMGLYGVNGTFPDWDMLPGICATTMALWTVTGAPLMYGYGLPASNVSLGYLTNPEALAINAQAENPFPFENPQANLSLSNTVQWNSTVDNGGVAVAVVNIANTSITATTKFAECCGSLSGAKKYRVRDIFALKDLGEFDTEFTCTIPAYVKHNRVPDAGAKLFLVTAAN